MDENHRKPEDSEFTGKDFNLIYSEYKLEVLCSGLHLSFGIQEYSASYKTNKWTHTLLWKTILSDCIHTYINCLPLAPFMEEKCDLHEYINSLE